MNSIGNISQFSRDVLRILVTTLGLGYMGGSILSLTKSNTNELHELFPTDIYKAPYNTESVTLNLDNIKKHGLLYLFTSFTFPYDSMIVDPPKEISNSASDVFNWLKLTCAYTFISWRGFYKTLISLGSWIQPYFLGDVFLFYIYPYIAIAIVMFGAIPVIGYIMSLYQSATIKGIDYPVIYTFSFFMGWIYGFFFMFQDFTKLPGSIISFFMFGCLGMFLTFIKIPFWMGIAGALWIYAWTYLVATPFIVNDGMNKVVNEINDHKNGLIIIFIITVLRSAQLHLAPPVSLGALIFVVCYYLYKLYKWFRS
jgi:hypothetical protein